jgi:hypothetical protein
MTFDSHLWHIKTPEMTGTKLKFWLKFWFRLDSVPATGRNFSGILNLVDQDAVDMFPVWSENEEIRRDRRLMKEHQRFRESMQVQVAANRARENTASSHSVQQQPASSSQQLPPAPMLTNNYLHLTQSCGYLYHFSFPIYSFVHHHKSCLGFRLSVLWTHCVCGESSLVLVCQ